MAKQIIMDEKTSYMIGKLKEARLRSNLSQSQIADLMHVRQSTYSYWENGRNKIDPVTLQRLADILKVPIDYFTVSEAQDSPVASGSNIQVPADNIAQNISEKLLLKNFRKFNPIGQEKILELINYLNECHELTNFEFTTTTEEHPK